MNTKIPRSGQFRYNTPEKKAAEILTRWHKREWKLLLNYCQPSWVKNHPEGYAQRSPEAIKANPQPVKIGAYWEVRRLFGSMELFEAEILGTESMGVDDNMMITVNVRIVVKPDFRKKDLGEMPDEVLHFFDNGDIFYNLVMQMNFIREDKKGKPNPNGAWYVNPPSCYRIEMEG